MAKIEQYIARVGGLRALFIVGLVIMFFFITRITTPIPNFNNETSTVIYGKDDFVPPAYMNTNHLLIMIIFLVGLVVSFIRKEVKKQEMADIDEVHNIVKDYLKKRKSIKTDQGNVYEIGEYNLDKNFILRELREGGESKPYRYVVQINITDTDGLPHYLKAYVHPFSRYLSGFVDIDKPLEGEDQCPDCGKEFDIGYVSTEDYKKFRRIEKGEAD